MVAQFLQKNASSSGRITSLLDWHCASTLDKDESGVRMDGEDRGSRHRSRAAVAQNGRSASWWRSVRRKVVLCQNKESRFAIPFRSMCAPSSIGYELFWSNPVCNCALNEVYRHVILVEREVDLCSKHSSKVARRVNTIHASLSSNSHVLYLLYPYTRGSETDERATRCHRTFVEDRGSS